YTLDNGLAATQALGAADVVTESFVATVTDGHGASASQIVTVTVHGTNDAPVITSGNAVASVVEPGDLGFINEAGLSNPSDGGRPGLESRVDVDGVLDAHIAVGMSVTDMTATLNAVQTALGGGATRGDAIAATWEYLDARYSYTNDLVNEAQAKLAIVYAQYVHGGGMALLDVVAKYTPDGADADSAPDRVQSLHDNILGNLNWYGLADKLGGGSDAYHRIEAAVGTDPLLSGLFHDRPVYSGDAGAANGATAWDIGHGLYPMAQGTMVASDVDTASSALTWTDVTGSAGAYGTFAIDAHSGAWTYVLNPGAADPLKGGEQAVETFTVQVSDGLGGIDTATVTVTVTGTNDAPYDLALSAESIPAANPGYRVGEITVSDVDDHAGFTFTVNDSRFSVVTVTAGGVDHYYLETNQQVDGLPPSIAITVKDAGGLSYTENFAVTAPVQLFAADRTTLLGSFTTIQAAVDAAHGAGDFILVGSGTYKEQVVVDPTTGHGVDGLVIHGAGNVIVEAPDTLVSTGHALTGAMRTVDGIITVSNAHGVTIDGLTVDGKENGGSVTGSTDPTLVGIAYLNASGTVDHVEVTGVREPDAMFGVQRGVGIYVSNDAAHASNTFALTDSTVKDFQKTAVVVVNADVTITGNSIEGHGATDLTAQNGIQLVGATGEVSGNTVTGIGYIPQSWTASGILFWDSHDLKVTGNTITGPTDGGSQAVSFTAIYGMNSSDVEITGNTIAHVWYGVVGYEDGTFSSGVFAPGWTVGDSNSITDYTALALDFEAAPGNTHPFDVAGTAGNDYFSGGAGADHFQGNDGDDTFVATPGGGADVFDGGNGIDELDLSRLSGRVTVDLNAGVGGYAAHGLTFTSIENVTLNASDTSGGAASSVNGSAADNVIKGSGRADVIYGGDGNDTIIGNGGDDTISGGRGADYMDGGTGTNTLLLDARGAGDADVTHFVNLATGHVSGGQLDGDTILNFANVTAAHNTRADFTGDGNANVLIGGNENDVLRGGGGDDTLIGDLGYAGTPNADTLIGGAGNDTLIGGGGFDTADYSTDHLDGATHGIIANLGASTIVSNVATGSNVIVAAGTVFDGFGGRDTLTGIERIVATDFNDALYGGAGGQTLEGRGGNDYIIGGSGNDTLNGDDGDDTLAASAGDDTMNGGAGNDTFLISQNVGGTQVVYGGDGEDAIKLQQAGTVAVLRGDFGAANSVEHISGTANGNQMSVLTGDSGNNTLDFRGTELTDVVVQGGAGDDVIYASTQSNSIISAEGGGHDVFHGSSTDTTYRVSNNYNGATQVFDGGAGRDTIQLLQAGTIARLMGNFNAGGDSNTNSNNIDAIIGTAYGGQLSQIVGDGQNSVLNFWNVDLTNVIVGGGGGSDTIYASNTSNTIINIDGGGNDVFHGSSTDTTYRLSNNSAGATTVLDGGTGIDTIVLQQAGTNLVLSGNFNAGGNTDANSNSVEAITGTASGNAVSTLFGDGGANTLDFRGTVLTNVAINAGGGNDTVYVSQVSPGSISYNGGAGIDTLVIALTPDQLLNTGLLAQISALTPGAGVNGSVTDPSLSFSAASFEAIELQAQIGGALVLLNNLHVLMGTAGHDSGPPNNPPALIVTDHLDDSWAIYGGPGGDDVLRGGNANDILAGGVGIDVVDGRDGSDTYLMGAGDGFDVFQDTGTSGTDRIVATGDNVQIGALSIAGIEEISSGGFQHVKLIGSPSIHTTFDLSNVALHGIEEVWMPGTTSNDTIWTSNSSDADGGQNYRGGAGNDTFHLGTQDTNLLVSKNDGGFDSFQGNVVGDGVKHVLKAMDDDTHIGITTTYGNLADRSNSVDVITADGHSGVRIVGSDGAHDIWDFSQTQLVDIDGIYTGGGNDSVIGSAGNDTIDGGIGNDVLRGGDGNDTLYGGAGNDTLYGDAGNDVLYGGAGLNHLTGGDGHDTFVIDPSAMQEVNMVDVISDFNAAEDVLDLSDLLANLSGGAPADLNAAMNMVSVTATGGSAHVSVDTDGTGGAAPVEVASLTGIGTSSVISILYDDHHSAQGTTVA
ncbi:MAG: VCBS domain-containing protein, partial [Mesorhizobium sp.]